MCIIRGSTQRGDDGGDVHIRKYAKVPIRKTAKVLLEEQHGGELISTRSTICCSDFSVSSCGKRCSNANEDSSYKTSKTSQLLYCLFWGGLHFAYRVSLLSGQVGTVMARSPIAGAIAGVHGATVTFMEARAREAARAPGEFLLPR